MVDAALYTRPGLDPDTGAAQRPEPSITKNNQPWAEATGAGIRIAPL